MANTSVSGLVSGLDTASIISQLMQIEAQPQTNLKNRVSAEQKIVSALQAINTKLAGIATKAADLAKTTTWSAMAATSSNDKVTANASSGASASSLSFSVVGLASASTLTSDAHAATAKVLSDGSHVVALTKPDGATVDVDTGDGSLQGLAKAINAGNFGASATLIQVASGSYQLRITSATTGLTPLALAPGSTAAAGTTLALVDNYSAGTQAEIKVGTTSIKSDTNTFTGLMSGVDVTLQAGATGSATITVTHDAKSLSDSVKAMVDAVNSVLDDISTQSGYNADTKTSGPLAGEAELWDIHDQLVSTVTHGFNGGLASYAEFGIQVDRYGKLTFDQSKFDAAYAADPAKVENAFDNTVDGFATKLAKVSNTASDSYTGTLTLAIKGHNSEITGWQDDISGWDARLQVKRDALQRQYAALEVALGKMQDQASWLNGQISSLPKSS